jgi:hypothetical protein
MMKLRIEKNLTKNRKKFNLLKITTKPSKWQGSDLNLGKQIIKFLFFGFNQLKWNIHFNFQLGNCVART